MVQHDQPMSDETIVTDATDYTGWGSAVEASTVSLEPGLWALDNYGDVLLATVLDGKTYTWDSSIAARFTDPCINDKQQIM